MADQLDLAFPRQAEQPLHVVVAADPDVGICHIVTAYRPDREHFESDLKTQRK